jgi:hypothetical protein
MTGDSYPASESPRVQPDPRALAAAVLAAYDGDAQRAAGVLMDAAAVLYYREALPDPPPPPWRDTRRAR